MKYLLLLFFPMMLFVGCKPTEKGYKAAYDAALGKRQSSSMDIEGAIPVGAIQQVYGPQLKEFEGQQIYILNEPLKNEETSERLNSSYNVAVGTYKMNTNCKSQVEALKNEGYNAFAAIDSEGKYFSIAGSFQTMKEAVTFYNKYRQKNNRVYVGLPDSPVIIYTP